METLRCRSIEDVFMRIFFLELFHEVHDFYHLF